MYNTNVQLQSDLIHQSLTGKEIQRLSPPGINLTRRESECFYLLAKGFSIKKIAITLDVSRRTIEMFIRNIRTKMNNIYKSQLIEQAIEVYHSMGK